MKELFMFQQRVDSHYSKMLNKVLFLTIIFFFSGISVAFASAASGSGSINLTEDPVELELIQGIQNPRTLEFEYLLRVKSLIETDRVRVNWEIENGFIAPAEDETVSDQVPLREGEEIYIIKKFKPLVAGYENIKITAIAYGPSAVYDFFSFTEEEFFVNEDLLVSPDSGDNVFGKMVSDVLNVAKVVSLVIAILITLTIIYWRFKIWLSTD